MSKEAFNGCDNILKIRAFLLHSPLNIYINFFVSFLPHMPLIDLLTYELNE